MLGIARFRLRVDLPLTALPPGSRLAVVGRRDTLRLAVPSNDQAAEDQMEAIEGPDAARWPAWTAEGSALVYSRYQRGTDAGPPQLVVAAVPEMTSRTLYTSRQGDPPGIAPRVPHYVNPAPNGEDFAVVAATREGLGLFLCHTDASAISQAALVGAPLFTAWHPSSRFLAVHTGSELVVLDARTGERFQPDGRNALGFRAPAYSHDGEILACAVGGSEGVQITFSKADGTGQTPGTRFGNSCIFAFRPGTHDLYVAVAADPEATSFRELWKVTPGGKASLIFRGPLIAFDWSPAGDRMLVVYPSQSGDGACGLYMLDPEGALRATSEAILPSDDQRTWLTFFDQYARSHSAWIGGGQAVVFCGRAGTDRIPPSLGDSTGPTVYLWNGERGAPLQPFGTGEFAAGG